ncbi:hypothetical protein [Desulfatiferula olefinivorans]
MGQHRRGGGLDRRNGTFTRQLEGHFPARSVPESHLELAVDRKNLNLFGDIGQEVNRHLTPGHVGQIGVELAGKADVVGGEIQFAVDQELAVGADLDHHLAVEHLLGGVDGEDLAPAGDGHGGGEGRQEAAPGSHGPDPFELIDHLLFDGSHPLIRRHGGGQAESGIPQFLGVFNGRQAGEKFHACGEIVDGQTRIGFEHHAAGDLDVDEHAQGTQFGQTQTDGQTPQARHAEPALDAHEEDALGHGRAGVKDPDHVVVGIQLENAAHQAAVQLTAEQVALDRDADALDVDDGEFPFKQQRGVDFHPFDGPGELKTRRAGQTGDRGGQGDHEITGGVLDIVPLNADGGDADGQPGRPHETVTRGRTHGQKNPEAPIGHKTAVTHEGEVPGLSPQFQGTEFEAGPHGNKGYQFLIRRSACVQVEAHGKDFHDTPEGYGQGVGLEDEGLDPSVFEFKLQAQGLGVGCAV